MAAEAAAAAAAALECSEEGSGEKVDLGLCPKFQKTLPPNLETSQTIVLFQGSQI